jgi:hypothetical protein
LLSDPGFSGFFYKGSEAVLKDRASSVRTKARREALISKDILVSKGDRLDFTKDHEFTSPSHAAATMHGGAANGLIAWKTKDSKTLKELDDG